MIILEIQTFTAAKRNTLERQSATAREVAGQEGERHSPTKISPYGTHSYHRIGCFDKMKISTFFLKEAKVTK